MRYSLNQPLFKRRLVELGFASMADFSKRAAIHRNTILNYLSGKNVFTSSFEAIAKKLDMDPMGLLVAASETKSTIQGIDEIRPIIARIVKFDKQLAVMLIGSRAKKRARKYSDWDISITRGINPIQTEDYFKIKNIVEDISEDIPRMVDVVNLDAAPLWFLEGLDHDPIFLDGNQESYIYFKGVLNGIQKRRKEA